MVKLHSAYCSVALDSGITVLGAVSPFNTVNCKPDECQPTLTDHSLPELSMKVTDAQAAPFSSCREGTLTFKTGAAVHYPRYLNP